MSGQDDLKYFVVRDGKGENPFRPEAGFKHLEDAEHYLSQTVAPAGENERYPTPFTCRHGEDKPIYDILVDCVYPALFCDILKTPVADLVVKDLFMTKGQVSDLVFTEQEHRNFDFALPREFINEVVAHLVRQDWGTFADIRDKIVFGTVWFYPRAGQFRMTGRPAAITEPAKKIWVQYYSTLKVK